MVFSRGAQTSILPAYFPFNNKQQQQQQQQQQSEQQQSEQQQQQQQSEEQQQQSEEQQQQQQQSEQQQQQQKSEQQQQQQQSPNTNHQSPITNHHQAFQFSSPTAATAEPSCAKSSKRKTNLLRLRDLDAISSSSSSRYIWNQAPSCQYIGNDRPLVPII